MAKESLTDTGADQSSSDIDNESLLDEQQQDQSADEQQDDTDSGDSDSQDSDSDSSSQAQDEDASDESSDDDGLNKFAKSQGFDPETLTDGERKALKIAHDNQKAFRNKSNDSTVRDLQQEVTEVHKPEEGADVNTQILQRQAILEARVETSDFFQENPEARNYAEEMRDVLKDERETYGVEAARALSQNLPRLYREARFRRGDFDGDAAREAGRREEREVLRKKQEGSADSGHASSRQSSTPKIDKDWVMDTYIPGNPEHEKLLEKAIADGTL